MGVILKQLRETHLLGTGTREWLASTPRSNTTALTHRCIAGFSEARDGYQFVRENPPFSMILVSERGEGRVWIDGAWRAFLPGHAYITAPHVLHAYHIKPASHWRLHWVIYGAAVSPPTLVPGKLPQLARVDATGLRHAIEGLCHEHAGRADSGLLETWTTLVNRMAARIIENDDTEPRLERLWLAVRRDLGNAWDLARMSRVAGMSEENLRRLCLQHIGRSPGAHLTYLRMLAASDVLTHTREKIGSIAARMGYSDSFAFSTAFKRVIGQAPLHFRNRHHRGRATTKSA